MAPAKINVHPDTDPALFVCQNPETVLQTGRPAPGGRQSHRNRRAGPNSSGRLAELNFLRGGRFWFDIEPEFHFLGNPPSDLWGNGATTGPRDPMVPVEINVHPDTESVISVCRKPETVLQTDRSAPT